MQGKQYAWQRPWITKIEIPPGAQEYYIPSLLRDLGLAVSSRDAKRICDDRHVWFLGPPDRIDWETNPGSDRYYLYILPGDSIGVGKNELEACCNRI